MTAKWPIKKPNISSDSEYTNIYANGWNAAIDACTEFLKEKEMTMTKDKEIEELANDLQEFVIEDSDLLKGRVFRVISHQRCSTIAECLIAKGYSRHPASGLVPLDEEDVYKEITNKSRPPYLQWERVLARRICERFGKPDTITNKCQVCGKDAFTDQKENGWRCQNHALFGSKPTLELPSVEGIKKYLSSICLGITNNPERKTENVCLNGNLDTIATAILSYLEGRK